MKKIIIAIAIILALFALTSCGITNHVVFHPDATYKTAIINQLNGKTVSVIVETFSDASYNDRVTIVSTDGKVYLTSWENVILIGEVIKDD